VSLPLFAKEAAGVFECTPNHSLGKRYLNRCQMGVKSFGPAKEIFDVGLPLQTIERQTLIHL
jgi:hypothetical protein